MRSTAPRKPTKNLPPCGACSARSIIPAFYCVRVKSKIIINIIYLLRAVIKA